ncbi:MAG: bifunctional DNA-formamidopyrimidine glycosylase/DNA-(apurinic or apyrimidinic site) lyase [bacterium]|nr:bifunctional DNA-formamidopyrimidine glycosylase/DNA-(apurinic or apyrimidinic site) lyase [bacterium]
MPELPEVETVRRGIEPAIRGKRILSAEVIPDPKGIRTLRRVRSAPAFRKNLTNRIIEKVDRRGKYLLIYLNHDEILIIHLGMSGRLLIRRPSDPPDPHTRIIFHLEKKLELRFADPRKFGEVYLFSPALGETAVNPLDLGPEPFDPEITSAWLLSRLAKSSRPIKAALLDQYLIAGIGNIYSDEILHASRIRPDRNASSITREEADRIVRHTRRILKLAISKRGTTAGDGVYRDSRNQPGSFQNHLQVYAREGEGCYHCRSKIASRTIGGRTAHFCPECQK